jgi:superfamily I DNA/RNA helicase
MQLSVEQSKPVTNFDNCHIQSIPGSGKTRVLVAKVSALLALGFNRIILATFTNAAADEMKERIRTECGSLAYNVKISTLHSLMTNHIKKNLPEFKLVSPEKQSSLLHSIYVQEYQTPLDYIEFEKYYLNGFKHHTNKQYDKLIESYNESLVRNKLYTLTNLISFSVSLIAQNKLPLLNAQHMLIDEYQDCDIDQVKLVIQHARAGVKITTVGDTDQGIYSFAGAINQKAFDLLQTNVSSEQYLLEENYRSYREILDVAFRLVSHNKQRVLKKYRSIRGDGGVVQYRRFENRFYEAEWIVQKIQREPMETIVLARTNRLLDYVANELEKHQIEFKRINSQGWFDDIAVKLFLTLLDSLLNKDYRILQKTLNVIFVSAKEKISAKLIFNKDKLPVELTKGEIIVVSALRNGNALIASGIIEKGVQSITDGIYPYMEKVGYKNAFLVADVSNILCRMSGTLKTRLFNFNNQKKQESSETVKLMTIHASKGLEAERVFVFEFSNKVIPASKQSNYISKEQHMAEERNISFVAFTRAKNELYVLCCKNSSRVKDYYGDSIFAAEIFNNEVIENAES